MTNVRSPAPTIQTFAPDARRRAVWRGLPCLAVAAACALAVLPAPAGAATIPAYFGWNYVTDAPLNAAPSEMDLTSFTYDGAAGPGEVIHMPAFTGLIGGPYTGLPDGLNGGVIAYIPTYTTVINGDGETTRNNTAPGGRLLPIDWVPPNTNAPYLPAGGLPYYTIGITSFTTDAKVNGNPVLNFGNYTGFPNDPAGKPDYIVGLIQDNAVPLQPNEELYSTLPIYQGDIYNIVNGTAGNPTLSATNLLGAHDQITVVFAAAVPEPASLALLALPTLVLFRLRRARLG